MLLATFALALFINLPAKHWILSAYTSYPHKERGWQLALAFRSLGVYLLIFGVWFYFYHDKIWAMGSSFMPTPHEFKEQNISTLDFLMSGPFMAVACYNVACAITATVVRFHALYHFIKGTPMPERTPTDDEILDWLNSND